MAEKVYDGGSRQGFFDDCADCDATGTLRSHYRSNLLQCEFTVDFGEQVVVGISSGENAGAQDVVL